MSNTVQYIHTSLNYLLGACKVHTIILRYDVLYKLAK